MFLHKKVFLYPQVSIIHVIYISLELLIRRQDVLAYISILIPTGDNYPCNLHLTRSINEKTRCY